MTTVPGEDGDDGDGLEALRRGAGHCRGLAWLAGSPMAVIASAGEPGDVALADWDAVAKAAPVLLRDGPVPSPEVLIRGEAALMLLAERAGGVAAVIVAASGGSPGMALVQARMLASQVEAAAPAPAQQRAATEPEPAADDTELPELDREAASR